MARLYRCVAEQRARGIFHGVDGVPMAVLQIARATSVAAGAEGRTRQTSVERARESLGAFADVKCLDVVIGSRRATEIGWRVTRPPFAHAAESPYREWADARASCSQV